MRTARTALPAALVVGLVVALAAAKGAAYATSAATDLPRPNEMPNQLALPRRAMLPGSWRCRADDPARADEADAVAYIDWVAPPTL